MPSSGAVPQHSMPFAQGRLNRGGKAAPSSPGDRCGAYPLWPLNGLSPAAEGGLEREPQAGATALAGGRPAAHTPMKPKRARPADGLVQRHRAEHPHQSWAMDLQFDATADGRRLKFLNVIDEHSRLCLAIRVCRRCKARDVVTVLEELTSDYPARTFIRSDNGPEFIAQALRDCCVASTTTITTYIEPGSSWQNRFPKSFNGRFRDVFLNTELFTTAPEAQLLVDR